MLKNLLPASLTSEKESTVIGFQLAEELNI